ncbi:MAG: SDR family NAD(P)-dependent oxidoreductase [Sandaracinaceae bacterium]|nr:SDR family NAD(P)-dependent oxidoreductase [Sandaracinaceae bacterium]
MGLLDGKVILITGAGNGLGRAYALACAREGARVVVNDLGGTRDGAGGGQSAADQVVAEILALGGQAVPSYDSVTDPDGAVQMVRIATDTWGRLDGVVNNAGILRDGTFRKMDEAQWRSVLDVHLNGTYNVTRAAVDALAAQGGAVVNTSSISGMIGNFGQANYAAAKAGIYGLTRVLALELRKWGVTANCVAPIAKTRMTEDIDRVEAEWTPDHVAPIVVYLLSELGRGVTGRVFGVRGNHLHVYEVHVNDGVEKPGAEPWTPAEIAATLDAITSFDVPVPTPPTGAPVADPMAEVFVRVPGAFMADKAGDYKATIHFVFKDAPGRTLRIGDGRAWAEAGLVGAPDCTIKTDAETFGGIVNGTIDAQKAFMKGRITADNMGVLMKFAMYFRFDRSAAAEAPAPAPIVAAAPAQAPPKTWPIGKTWDGGFAFVEPRYTELYAAATDDSHVAYLGPDAVAPPMFHVRLFKGLLFAIATDPELDLDMLRLVHGEHDVTLHRPLRVWDLVQLRARLVSVEEKSSGLVVTSQLLGYVEGTLVIEARTVFFIRGPTKAAPQGDGEKQSKARAAPAEPARPPDFTREIKVGREQSYRYAEASLDDNPIHVDPDTARAAGLPDVILQGLCTMAFAGRAVVSAMIPGRDPSFLKRLSVRFARPVLNGATLTTQIWKKGRVAEFIVKDELGNVVISNGLAEVR